MTAHNNRITAHAKEEADTLLLVLASQGIAAYLEYNDECYDLILDNGEPGIEFAREVIALFYAENSPDLNSGYECRSHLTSPSEKSIVLTRSSLTAVIASVLVLCMIHASTSFNNNHHAVVLKYGASALYIFQGEYYRVVTALMIHADIEHLAGNVAGILFLATPLCSIIGAARGLFLTLLSGAAGNLLNAYLYRSVNLSIGASTAVMSTVGILVALQIIRRHHESLSISLFNSSVDRLRGETLSGLRGSALFIIASGVTFVGMMSSGKQTDLSAHLFGFLAGLLIGFPGLLLIKKK